MSPLHLSNPFRRDPEAPSLKERGAALKAGIARVVRRPAAPVPPEATSPAPAEPPYLADACNWAVAHMAWINDTNHPDGEWPDERVATEIQRFDAVLNRIADEPSQDIEDVAAKARAVLADWRTTLGRPDPSASDRALLTLLREVGALSPTGPKSSGALADDIIACWREYAAIPEANREDCDPLYERWWARRDALLNAADALPATRDSLLAKALAFAWIWGDDAVTQGQARADHTTDGRLALDINAIASGHPAEDVPAASPDPFFAAAGAARAATAAVDAFERRVAEHKPKGWMQEEWAFVAKQNQAQDAALATIPTTQAGRIALADYMAELMKRYGMADGGPPEDGSSFWAFAYHALSAALRAPIRPEASEAVAEPDLSTLTLNDLAHLHMVASTAWTTTSMFINAPFSWDEKRENHSPLGDLIEAETDRWADLATAAAEEAAQREPRGEDERDRRLEIATQQAMLGGGPIEDKALIADLAAAWGA